MSTLIRRLALRPVLTLCAALAALAGTAPAALAGSYEQVSRATGPAGVSPIVDENYAFWVSNSGRTALYSSGRFDTVESNDLAYVPPFVVKRDIVSNTTTPLGDGRIFAVLDVDDAESKALAMRLTTTGDDQLVVVPLVGTGPITVLAQQQWPRGQFGGSISGDGTKVVYSYWGGPSFTDQQPYLADLVTGTQTPLAIRTGDDGEPAIADTYFFDPDSASRDGKVLATETDYGKSVYWVDGVRHETGEDGRPFVSRDGTRIFEAVDGAISSLDPTTGQSLRFPLPAGWDFARIAWVADNGGKLVALGPAGKRPQYLTLATGRWAPFGGSYAGLLGSGLYGSAIARNARYALVRYGPVAPLGQIALVDLTGADLPGSQEPLGPASYASVSVTPPDCGVTGGQVSARFVRSRLSPATPAALLVVVSVDGKQVFSRRFVRAADPASPPGTDAAVANIPTGQSARVDLYTIDASGVRKESETLGPLACLSSPF